MAETTMDAMRWLRKQLESADADLLRELLQLVVEALMGAEADALCGAPYGERSAERVNRRNGYRTSRWDTRHPRRRRCSRRRPPTFSPTPPSRRSTGARRGRTTRWSG